MTIWYCDSCHCISHVENAELLVKCDGHNTYNETLTANQGLNLKYGNMEIPQSFQDQKFSFESDRDAAIRLNRNDIILTLDRFDEIAQDRAVSKQGSTISTEEIENRKKLHKYLDKPNRDRKIEPTRQRIEEVKL